MKRFTLVLMSILLASIKVGAVDDSTYTIGDSVQVTSVDSVEVAPGLMLD